MSRAKLVHLKVRHRFSLDHEDSPVAFCSTEPYMNYQIPKNPKLVRTWDETTCGYCHHLFHLGKRPKDRTLKAVQ